MEIKAKVEEKGWDLSDCTIHPELQKMLVEQMAHELRNHNLYETFSEYYNKMGLKKLYTYYSNRAQEEYTHYTWCKKFADESDMCYTVPSVDPITEKWEDVIKPFEITVDVEIETTEMIYDMADKARELGDHIFLQWLYRDGLLVAEQSEEMSISRKALAIMKQDDSILSKQDAIEQLYGN